VHQVIAGLGRGRLICLLTALALLGASLGAQGAIAAETGIGMVKDIDPGSDSSNPGPWSFTTIGGTAYFEADDGTHGGELWKTDGTEAGTVMVKDIDPGPEGSEPIERTAFAGDLYFFADDGTHGNELWKSDGTEAGTVMVKDINPGAASAAPLAFSDFAEAGGKLYFGAEDGTHGNELWVTDGTEAGTHMVADINPGAAGSEPYYLAGFDGEVFFAATTASHGRELWKSDGTEAGTVMVKDINATCGLCGSYPQYMTPFDGHLYFNAMDGSHGQELWRTDGTEAGTELVKDINTTTEFGQPGSSSPSNFQAVDGTLYFDADDGTHGGELWKTDGTEAGTVMLKDIDTESTGVEFTGPGDLTAFDGAIYFDADDGAAHGYELWKTDGTEAGTELVKDINPGAGNGYPGNFTVLDGKLYFSADDGTHGGELWQSDGTEAGTVMLKDINPGAEESHPELLTVLGDALLFKADDGAHGTELWSTAASLTPPTSSGSETTTGSGATTGSTQTSASVPAPKPTKSKSTGKGFAKKRQEALKRCKKLSGKAKVKCVKRADQIGKHKKKGDGKKGRGKKGRAAPST
jgi:ELWxxDGT repeat protein